MAALASWFMNAGLLGWLALASVPIIIHLLIRRRVQRLPWAAMSFLAHAHRRTRRRIQLENLLLLALRMLAIILLVLGAARPFLEATSPIADLAHSQRHVAVIVDVSGSMGYDEGTGPGFEKARRAAERVLSALKPKSGDTAVLIPHASPADPRESEARVSGYLDLDRLKGVLSGLDVSDRTTHFAEAFETARKTLDPYKTGKEVYLISDLQKIGFGAREVAASPGAAAGAKPSAEDGYHGVREALNRLVHDGAVIKVVDTGPANRHPENLGIVAFSTPPRVVTTEMLTVLESRVRNFGREPHEVSVHYYFGNDANPRRTSRPKVIAPGREASFITHMSFRGFGPRPVAVRAVLKPFDNLASDDERLLVIPVRNRIKVLLVRGESTGTEAFEATTYFLRLALNPFAAESDVQGPFDPEEIAWHQLPRTDFSGYDLIVLADCSVPGASEAEALESFVRAGGGLLITWGTNTDPDRAREVLLKRTGLLPVVPERVVGDADYSDPRNRQYHLVLGARHPATRHFHADKDVKAWLEDRTLVGRYLKSEEVKNTHHPVNVLLRLDDEARSPILAERRVGAGKVMVLTTTAHTKWNNLPVDRQAPLFLMLVDGIANHLVVPAEDPLNLTVGEPLSRIYTTFPGKRELTRPSGSRVLITPVRLEEDRPDQPGDTTKDKKEDKPGNAPGDGAAPGKAKPGDDGKAFPRFRIQSEPLMERGVYRLTRDSAQPGTGASVELFAVNPNPKEGDLTRFSIEELRADVFKDIPFETPALDDVGSSTSEGPKGGELWKWLILAAVACLAIEMIVAHRIGARQK